MSLVYRNSLHYNKQYITYSEAQNSLHDVSTSTKCTNVSTLYTKALFIRLRFRSSITFLNLFLYIIAMNVL